METANTDLIVSPLFDVKQTTYGGRACFAREDSKEGTNILSVNRCLSSSISHEFRKEVCHNCLKYNNGKIMKVKLDRNQLVDDLLPDGKKEQVSRPKTFNGAGLWFCCDSCRDEYISQDNIIELIETFETLLAHFQSQAKRRNTASRIEEEHKLNETFMSPKIIGSNWSMIEKDWIPRIDQLKASKKARMLPLIYEEEYQCCRFVAQTLFNLKYTDPNSVLMKTFEALQSNEQSRIHKFPILLDSQTKVLQTLYVLLPFSLKPLLTISLFRHILGSEYGNAFGIWQDGESNDSREYLGFWIVPQASYFNHSCSPNVDKKRIGNKLTFTLNSNVVAGQQLCIDYSGILSLDVHKRQEILSENWFFQCGCEKCQLELQTIH